MALIEFTVTVEVDEGLVDDPSFNTDCFYILGDMEENAVRRGLDIHDTSVEYVG